MTMANIEMVQRESTAHTWGTEAVEPAKEKTHKAVYRYTYTHIFDFLPSHGFGKTSSACCSAPAKALIQSYSASHPQETHRTSQSHYSKPSSPTLLSDGSSTPFVRLDTYMSGEIRGKQQKGQSRLLLRTFKSYEQNTQRGFYLQKRALAATTLVIR